MSDITTKIIPVQHDYVASEEKVKAAVTYIKEIVPDCQVTVNISETTQFVDCGGELEEITCPSCGESVSFDWWGEAMETAGENEFSDLSVKLPCCGHDSSLNALKYYLPCGFARMEIGIENLEKTLDEEQLAEIGKILGTKVKVILARY